MVAAEYAKPVEVMEYQISAPPSSYVMPMNHKKSIVSYDNQMEFRFYLIDHKNNAVIVSMPKVSYHKVSEIEVKYEKAQGEIQRFSRCKQHKKWYLRERNSRCNGNHRNACDAGKICYA